MKALSRTDEAIPWRSIEVRRDAHGAPSLELSGVARESAARHNIGAFALSLTHEGPLAAAVVWRAGWTTNERDDTQRSARCSRPRPAAGRHRLARRQADLFQAGMSSHASVNVMLALEDAFDIEFPDNMLKRRVFESVAAIARRSPGFREQAA